MPDIVPPLAFFCLHALAPFPHHVHRVHRVPAAPALLDALPHAPDPRLWAALAQLVHPLPPHLHDHHLPLSHPDLPLLQTIPDTPDFALVTLVSLPNCPHLRDDNIANLRTLHRLLALDLRGCSISSYALTALARGLAVSPNKGSARIGTWGLRLLSLHGCPNIDNNVLDELCKFPLLSAIDLRFTRCTPTAVDTRLSSLGFCPSGNNSLFHPASLSVALCSLEKVAYTASDPVSLYSCPPQSVFRVYVDELNHFPSRLKKIVPVDISNKPRTTIRTITSAEDIVVFIPPPRKPAKNDPSNIPFSVVDPVVSASPPIDQHTSPGLVSNVSSFYGNVPARSGQSRPSILPLSALAVQSSEGGKLDPLAIARPPPPWNAPGAVLPKHYGGTVLHQNSSPDYAESSEWRQPVAQALNNPLKVDRARLRKRGSDTVADMVHQFASKRLKVESEFALAKTRAAASVKSRNPFLRSARSVFAESSTKVSGSPPPSVHEFSKETGSDMQMRVCRSLPLKTERQPEQGADQKGAVKPLKPITTFKPPILPKELLPSSRYASKHEVKLKQTQLSFSREEREDGKI